MILEVKNLNKRFGEKHVLKNISFTANSSNTFGLLGRNGSGKSTTIRSIMGILSSDSGEITIDGIRLSDTNFKFGYLPEERGLYQKVTILDQMIYFGSLRGLSKADAKKSALNLLKRLDAEEYAKRKAITLSKGNQQKIQLAIALINDPDIIILDEPYSGLDPVNGKILRDLIEENARLSKIILFSSHQLENVEQFCEDICIIDKGEVILSGNLVGIKDKYPRDKILITPIRGQESILKNALDTNPLISAAIIEYTYGKNGFLIALRDINAKNSILNLLTLSDSSPIVHAFSIVEPTLLEIFLEKVGVSNE